MLLHGQLPIAPQTHSTGEDDSWHKADKGSKVSMDEAHHHQHSSEDDEGVGTRWRDVVDHMGGGLRLVAYHYHILGG